MASLTKLQKIIIGSGIALLAIIGFIILQCNIKDDIIINANSQSTEVESKGEDKPKEEYKLPKEIMVHISGRVKAPGVIKITENARIDDAVLKAGGMLKDADLDRINLAAVIKDGDKIYIPKKGEQIPNYLQNNLGNSKTGNAGTGVININSASAEELDKIPGVGASTAAKIIEYRNKNGGFKTVDDLKKVTGIGDKKFEKLKGYITI